MGLYEDLLGFGVGYRGGYESFEDDIEVLEKRWLV